MAELSVEQVGRYDSLYISPRSGDAFLSCAARMHLDARDGRSALLLTLFEGPAFRTAATSLPILAGVDQVSLGLQPARHRHPGRGALSSLRFDSFPEDSSLRERLARVLVDLRPRVGPRHVFAPLGVGGHIDHRLAYEAAMEAFGGREAGRNVFLYEDRPEAFGPGLVRLRLAFLGARLPAGAVRSAEPSSLVRHVARHHRGAQLRGEGGGPLDRFRAARRAMTRWREVGAWNPQKAFGPRLQPVVQVADSGAADFAQAAATAIVPIAHGASARYRGMASSYARRLGGGEHVERYWLLLPILDGGREPVTDVVDDPLI
jgi:LmbE family N-acetylglucosaminyl deacetylase